MTFDVTDSGHLDLAIEQISTIARKEAFYSVDAIDTGCLLIDPSGGRQWEQSSKYLMLWEPAIKPNLI